MLFNRLIFYMIAFFMGFCSLSYEIILATKFSRLTGEGIYIYPGFIGLFIFFMGMGSFMSYRVKGLKEADPLMLLLGVEYGLTLLGYGQQMGIDLARSTALSQFAFALSLCVGVVFGAFIGFLTGLELPVLFRYVQEQKWGQGAVRRLIFFDYCASFCASVMLVLFLFPKCGLLGTSFIVAFCNFLVCLILLKLLIVQNKKPYRKNSICIFVLALVFLATAKYWKNIDRFLINSIYTGEKNELLIAHFNTPYQQVLLFMKRKDLEPIKASQKEILRDPQGYYLYALLNDEVQFYNILGAESDAYHTFLIDPFLILNPRIKEVLILGGGDGLPARQLVPFDQIEKITMVDLDEKWVEFTRNHPLLKFNTHNALNDPRLSLHYMDAFKWVLKTKEMYDAVFIDFPEADNLAAVRTISVQFFRDVKRRLNSDGIIVVQNDGIPPQRVIEGAYQSAVGAGLYPLFGSKVNTNALEDDVVQLVLFSREESRQHFLRDYQRKYIYSKRHANEQLYGHLDYHYVTTNEPWISLYDPQILRLGWRGDGS